MSMHASTRDHGQGTRGGFLKKTFWLTASLKSVRLCISKYVYLIKNNPPEGAIVIV